jgi:dTDP-4-amino-4,6-dideoxygalactose transaminase
MMSPPPLPASEKAGETLLSLPMFPGLTDAEADEVIRAVRGYFTR